MRPRSASRSREFPCICMRRLTFVRSALHGCALIFLFLSLSKGVKNSKKGRLVWRARSLHKWDAAESRGESASFCLSNKAVKKTRCQAERFARAACDQLAYLLVAATTRVRSSALPTGLALPYPLLVRKQMTQHHLRVTRWPPRRLRRSPTHTSKVQSPYIPASSLAFLANVPSSR